MPVDNRVCEEEYPASKKTIRLAEREILTLVYKLYIENPSVLRLADNG
jgi:hypothetical protein